MAGGFIMRHAQWQGGQSNTASDRALFIVQTVAQLLIDTNTGWELDASHNATINDTMTDDASSPKVYILFLKSSSGEKLMVGYSISNSFKMPVPFGFLTSASSGTTILYGLFTSMIPAGSNSEFGSIGNELLPLDATLVHSAAFSNATSWATNMAKKNTAGAKYNAQIVTNGSIIAFRMYTDDKIGSWWFTGPIVETLAHPALDTLPTAKMLSIPFTYGDKEGEGRYNMYNTNGKRWKYPINDSYYDKYNEIDLFRADGEHLQSAGGQGIFWDGASQQTLPQISNAAVTGFERWVAIYLCIGSANPIDHYIVKGDGMKGYFNTNFLRYVDTDSYTFGQTFDNGNFVYISKGVAMGWDASNAPLNAP